MTSAYDPYRKNIPRRPMANVHKTVNRQSIERIAKSREKSPPPPPQPTAPSKSNYTYRRTDPVICPEELFPVPPWFSQKEPSVIDVSIIIPMFRSAKEVFDQINTWEAVSGDGLTKEIIYVDDGCPDDSANWVIKGWESFRNRWNNIKNVVCANYENYIGKIIKFKQNSGFFHACNIGFNNSKGKYVIFLHADTMVTPDWVTPIVEVLKREDAGIVGNLQLKKDGSIDSAGRKWMRDTETFDDIGKDVWEGKRVSELIDSSLISSDVVERDAVSGCCFGMRRDVFHKSYGFAGGYRFNHWQDSDLCMRVKEIGYKVYFQPNSIIYHDGGCSGSDSHPFMSDSANLFRSKWVTNGKIERLLGAS